MNPKAEREVRGLRVKSCGYLRSSASVFFFFSFSVSRFPLRSNYKQLMAEGVKHLSFFFFFLVFPHSSFVHSNINTVTQVFIGSNPHLLYPLFISFASPSRKTHITNITYCSPYITSIHHLHRLSLSLTVTLEANLTYSGKHANVTQAEESSRAMKVLGGDTYQHRRLEAGCGVTG